MVDISGLYGKESGRFKKIGNSTATDCAVALPTKENAVSGGKENRIRSFFAA